jgi:hypothetical protein
MPFLTFSTMDSLERGYPWRAPTHLREHARCVLPILKLINSWAPRWSGVGARIDLAGPRHGEELVDAVVHRAARSVVSGRCRACLDDDRIIDMDADHLADHD